jgi:hypothetical protein
MKAETRRRLMVVGGALLLGTIGCGEGMEATEPANASVKVWQPGNPVTTSPSQGDIDAELASQGFDNDNSMRLRAQIDVPGRGIIKFYEPEDGEIVISEVGVNGVSPMITPQIKQLAGPVQMYEALAHQPAPIALADAWSRAAIRRDAMATRTDAQKAPEPDRVISPVRRVIMPRTTTGDIETVRAAADTITINNSYDQWFFDNFCARGSVDGAGWTYHHTWMYSGFDGSWGTVSDIHWIDSTVSVFEGWSVHHLGYIRPWYTWSTYANQTIKNGFWNQFHRVDNGTDFDAKGSTDQVDLPDWYHWCIRADTAKRLIIGSI